MVALTIYTDDEIARIQVLTDEGWSGSRIAEIVTQEFGRAIRKNMIAGLWNRKRVRTLLDGKARQLRGAAGGGLTNRIKARRGRLHASGLRRHQQAPWFNKRAAALIEDDGKLPGVEYMQNTGCKWVLGDRKDSDGLALCCGQERFPESPYCESHAARAFTPNVKSKTSRPFILRKAA